MTAENSRLEQDFLGSLALPKEALYGIHTARALTNFPLAQRPVCRELVHAYGAVKLAAAQTNHELGSWDERTYSAIASACTEMMEGKLDAHIQVDALQGGAGTSTNMNVNEVIANRALQLMNRAPGDYDIIHPINDINLHQSTNDTYPSALKVATIGALRDLEQALVALLQAFQAKEKEFAHVVKVGRTQMQDAVLTTMGRSMSAYAEAFGRDRWRVYKCEERLRVINLGGTAIGSGLGAPRKYIFTCTEKLKRITGFGLARAENMVDCTQNTDAFVEVSGILSACASNLLKTGTDLRLMSSGPDAGLAELKLPELQSGSSIMPGKINPVIPETVSQAALCVIANHSSISQASAMGSLELNAFVPLIADHLLNSIRLLANACRILESKCINGLTVNEAVCAKQVRGATSTITALIDVIGYKGAEQVLQESEESGKSIQEIVVAQGLLSEDEYRERIAAESVLRLGNTEERG